jgi:hypothetical protein
MSVIRCRASGHVEHLIHLLISVCQQWFSITAVSDQSSMANYIYLITTRSCTSAQAAELQIIKFICTRHSCMICSGKLHFALYINKQFYLFSSWLPVIGYNFTLVHWTLE